MEFSFDTYTRMSVLNRARLVLSEITKSLTHRQHELLAMNDAHAMPPRIDVQEWYSRIEIQRRIESLNKLIALHENMPSAPEPIVQRKKTFEPTDWRKD